MANKIVHIEFVEKDLKAAGEFYNSIFGWEAQPMGDDYSVFSAGDGPGGGPGAHRLGLSGLPGGRDLRHGPLDLHQPRAGRDP